MTKDPHNQHHQQLGHHHYDNNNYYNGKNPPTEMPTAPHIDDLSGNGNVTKPTLVFNCQLAHGSPTGFITGFASVKELYQKISECYDFSMDEVSRAVPYLITNTHTLAIWWRYSGVAGFAAE